MRKQSIYVPNNNCVDFARNVFHVDRLTKKKKKGQFKKKIKDFTSAIKLFINLLYKWSFYMIPGRKGREVKHKSQPCTCLHCSATAADPSVCWETRKSRMGSVTLHPGCLQASPASLSRFTQASLSPPNRCLSRQKFNKKPACVGAHPFHSLIIFHSKISKVCLAAGFSRRAKTILFLQGWSETFPSWSDLNQASIEHGSGSNLTVQIPIWLPVLHHRFQAPHVCWYDLRIWKYLSQNYEKITNFCNKFCLQRVFKIFGMS